MPKTENKTATSVSSETPASGTSFSIGGERPTAGEFKRDAEINIKMSFLVSKGLPAGKDLPSFREGIEEVFKGKHLNKA